MPPSCCAPETGSAEVLPLYRNAYIITHFFPNCKGFFKKNFSFFILSGSRREKSDRSAVPGLFCAIPQSNVCEEHGKGQFWMGSQALRDAVNSENDEKFRRLGGRFCGKLSNMPLFVHIFGKCLTNRKKCVIIRVSDKN